MKKLTDYQVAISLGWREGHVNKLIWRRDADKYYIPGHFGPPRFTTSIDTIVREIDLEMLIWGVGQDGRLFKAWVKKPSIARTMPYVAKGETAPLALCFALIAYRGKEVRG